MEKIIKLNPTSQTYYDIAEEKLNQDDFESAVYYFHKSYETGGGTEALAALGETYCDMGEPDEALKYLFLALDAKPNDLDICHNISQCFIDMDDEDTAFFYFQPGMSIDGFKKMLSETDELAPLVPPIRVLEKNDEMVLNIALKLFDSGDLKYGRELLLTVKPDSDYYLSANNLLALSSLEMKNPDEAIEFCKKAMSKKDNFDTRCNMMLAYHMQEDSEKVAEMSAYIEAQKLDLSEHKTASLAYIRMDNAKRAAFHLKTILDQEKNSRDGLVSYALAKYNLDSPQEAKQLMLRAARLYPSDLTILELIQAMGRGEKLALFPLLSDETADLWLDEIDKKLGKDVSAGKKLFLDDSFKHKIAWLFQTTMSIRQSKAVVVLGLFKEWYPFLKRLLINPEIDMSVKRLCLISLLLARQKGEVGIVIEGLYSRLRFKYPANLDPLFHKAYSIAFSSFAFADSGFEDRLCTATRKLLQLYHLLNVDNLISDENLLAATIFFATRHNRITDIESCAHLFGVKHVELVKYLKFFNINPPKKAKKTAKKD